MTPNDPEIETFGSKMDAPRPFGKYIFALSGVLLLVIGIFFIYKLSNSQISPFGQHDDTSKPADEMKVEAFKSKDDFIGYLQKASINTSMLTNGVRELADLNSLKLQAPSVGFGDQMDSTISEIQSPDRVSQTNVQIAALDEPDIIKTDGKSIFYSQEYGYLYEPFELRSGIVDDVSNVEQSQPSSIGSSGMIRPPVRRIGTRIIDSFPSEELAEVGFINNNGNLLLDDNNLIVIASQEITGIDVSNPQLPNQKWQLALDQGAYVQSTRLFDGKLYVVTQKAVDQNLPCPFYVTKESQGVMVTCDTIYHPIYPVSADNIYTVIKINPDDGSVSTHASFIAPSYQAITYISPNGVFLTYTYNENVVQFVMDFLINEANILPYDVIKKLTQLNSYEISDSSKMQEVYVILDAYRMSLKESDRDKFQKEIESKSEIYTRDHIREFERTGIVKFAFPDLEVTQTGSVPGTILNQFSIDEYQNNLRVATTIGGRMGIPWGNTESVNDVYVLDSSLKITGSIKDLGLSERIYSARFVGDKGYLVTFKQIDPFYVVDLSDAKKPTMVGELKIPGYSSYLHPIGDNLVLGIGMDGSKVKASMFDVSNPALPVEKSVLSLDEYWSDIQNTHHAFLLDDKHKVFFLPASGSGYIISYQDNLKTIFKTSPINAKRAVYINDLMYIVGDDKLIVVDELTWTEINSLVFSQ
ncbi:beta-propeller domain-containing protein [Candidatus Woesebacteria bacterium]|nr:MAG: beta-propeller domain-containing protein [Candidatus Woesebacteria bacterium]